ncbi:MAG: aldo/keto reductase [Pseudomonadota bacterium]
MKTDLLKAPRMGMGCWAIGGPFWNGEIPVGWAGANDQDSRAAIEAAWSCGVRAFDTSAVYGTGHSEELLGEVLWNRPDAIIVSKFGHSFDAATRQMTGPKTDPAYIQGSIEESRSRLRRDRVDVMLLHLNDLPIDEAVAVFDVLDEEVERGHIGSYGWSTDFPASLDAFANRENFTAVQHSMNLFFDAPSLSRVAQSHNLPQLIRSPLAMGILSGKYSDGQSVGNGDVRGNNDDWSGYFHDGRAKEELLAKVSAVRELITSGGRTLTQGALCWLVAKSPNTLPIPGAKTAAQAEENASALQFGPLAPDIMQEIEAVLDRPPEGEPRAR